MESTMESTEYVEYVQMSKEEFEALMKKLKSYEEDNEKLKKAVDFLNEQIDDYNQLKKNFENSKRSENEIDLNNPPELKNHGVVI